MPIRSPIGLAGSQLRRPPNVPLHVRAVSEVIREFAHQRALVDATWSAFVALWSARIVHSPDDNAPPDNHVRLFQCISFSLTHCLF